MSLSRHARRALVVALAAALMVGLGALFLSAQQQEEPVDIDKINFTEPSGAVYHTGRKTLFIVGDEGDICEIKTDGTLVKKRDLAEGGWLDIEGVTFDPATGLLYIVNEGRERIFEVDPDKLKILRTFTVPREFNGKTILKAGGQGIESITFVPDAKHTERGTFFVTNQGFKNSKPEDASCLIRLELSLVTKPGVDSDAKILKHYPMKIFDLAGMHYDRKKKRLLIISDGMNSIFAVSLDGKVLSKAKLPGQNQEGLAVDDKGFVYIAQDSGGIIKFHRDALK